jgi:hypothetical protein
LLLLELPPLARVPPEPEVPPVASIPPLLKVPPSPFPALLVWPAEPDVPLLALPPLVLRLPLALLAPPTLLLFCLVAPPLLPPGAEASGPLLVEDGAGGVSLHDAAPRIARASTLQMGTWWCEIRGEPFMS